MSSGMREHAMWMRGYEQFYIDMMIVLISICLLTLALKLLDRKKIPSEYLVTFRRGIKY